MIERKNYLDRIKPFIDKDIIKVLTGIRRCGKSVMLKLIKEELIKNGRSKEQFITLNFENLKNKPYCTTQALNDYIIERAKPNQKNYIFLDEIQEVEEWEKCINSLRADEGYDFDIYITGSNAKLLSGELATYLAGRYVEFIIYPFSFQEFLESLKLSQENITPQEAFKKYIKYGGMPFLNNLNYSLEASMQYLKDLYSTIILKDITQRNSIRDTDLLERIISYILMNVENTFSATSISKFFKSENRKASPETIEREFGILEKIQDNFPKYVISMDMFDMSRNGIKHFNIIDFLLDK